MSSRELCAALVDAFPVAPITRATIDEPTAGWANYEEHPDLVRLDGKTWREIEPAFIVRHAGLLTFAGSATYRAVLPAYLFYLVEHAAYNEVPFHVAGQLTRKEDPVDHKIFDRRIRGLTAEQRVVVHRVIAHLATKEPMQQVMSRALATWENLPESATS